MQAFANLPYWTTEFVGLGPYKVGTWVQGSYTEANAFDSYYLGRPKIDRVILRYYTDATVLATNLLSGDIDLVAIGSLKADDLAPIAKAWGPSGGTVIEMMTDVTWAAGNFTSRCCPLRAMSASGKPPPIRSIGRRWPTRSSRTDPRPPTSTSPRMIPRTSSRCSGGRRHTPTT